MSFHVSHVIFGNILRRSDGHFGSGQLVVVSGGSVGQLISRWFGRLGGQLVVREVGWSVVVVVTSGQVGGGGQLVVGTLR